MPEQPIFAQDKQKKNVPREFGRLVSHQMVFLVLLVFP